MWLAKIKLLDPDCVFATKIRKFGMQAHERTLSHFRKGDSYYFMSSHLLLGNEDSRKDYLKELRKDRRVRQLDVNGSLTVELIEKKKTDMDLSVYNAFYNPEVVFTKPGFVDSDGWEYYEVASWSREAISRIVRAVKKSYSGTLLKLVKTQKYEIYFPRFLPKISKGQRMAMELAIKEGYYDFPRKTEIEKLARMSKVSFSTYREHLRKAEKALVPFISRDLFFK